MDALFSHIDSGWLIFFEILYVLILIILSGIAVYDTKSSTKAVAYLLLIIFVPIIGIFVYLSFGINYRKRKMYSKKLIKDEHFEKELKSKIRDKSLLNSESDAISEHHKKLFQYLLREGESPLTAKNSVELIVNGEHKFPLVFEKLKSAKHHIHVEYYIYESDEIGQTFADILIQKAKEGLEVRFIYDDFGSLSLKKKFINKLKEGGVQVFPFYKIKFGVMANRMNYRNHRKIIIIDGELAFTGGINVSKKYVNKKKYNSKLYWRDTHLMIQGPGVYQLQYIFMTDWNFCAKDDLHPTEGYFPPIDKIGKEENILTQCAASGPDSDNPTVLYSIIQAINVAEEEILLTTPYFIPNESILEALAIAAHSGIKVKMLVPGISDSTFVNNASSSYYKEMLAAGVEIYRYQKGFVHAKSLVIDRSLFMVGTANMDHRSFELNFEVNAVIYNQKLAHELADIFENDTKDAEPIDYQEWIDRPLIKQVIEKICRLVAPML